MVASISTQPDARRCYGSYQRNGAKVWRLDHHDLFWAVPRLSRGGRPTDERGKDTPFARIRFTMQLRGSLRRLQFPMELSKRIDHKCAARKSKCQKYC